MISSFEQLVAWQKAQDLAVSVYSLTNRFPSAEKFALTSQIQRASASVSANIAEGFGRRSSKEKVQFYTIAYGSLLETKNFIYLGQRLHYVKDNEAAELLQLITDNQKLLNALIRAIKK